MSIEESVVERAAVHAALGDPARLAIVDALGVSDLSPGELAASLGIASNLLAHHLKVLEGVGLVRRVRSEGDRRRAYVTLRPAGTAVTSPEALCAPRVVFVCSRNSARSQMAVSLWKSRCPLPAISAGTHPAERAHPGAVAAARRHGLPLRPTRPRHVDSVVQPDDLVVAVCDQAHEELPHARRLHWSVNDPVRAGNDKAFDLAVVELDGRVARLAAAFRPQT